MDLSDMKPVSASREILAWDPDYTVTRMTHERGLDNPPHHHPHKQVIYVLEGNGVFVRGDEEMEVNAGDTIIIGPDVPHTFKYTTVKTVWLEYFTPGREDFPHQA